MRTSSRVLPSLASGFEADSAALAFFAFCGEKGEVGGELESTPLQRPTGPCAPYEAGACPEDLGTPSILNLDAPHVLPVMHVCFTQGYIYSDLLSLYLYAKNHILKKSEMKITDFSDHSHCSW